MSPKELRDVRVLLHWIRKSRISVIDPFLDFPTSCFCDVVGLTSTRAGEQKNSRDGVGDGAASFEYVCFFVSTIVECEVSMYPKNEVEQQLASVVEICDLAYEHVRAKTNTCH
jgi:hypothetical protein